jgi:uncharacterized membrane protein
LELDPPQFQPALLEVHMDRPLRRRDASRAASALAVLALSGFASPAARAQSAPRYSIVALDGVAQQINNSGAVAGWIYDDKSVAHAAIYSGGAWRDLGIPAGEQLSVLNGINDLGAGVGFSFVALPPPPGSSLTDNRWQAILAPAGAAAVQPLPAIAPDSFAYAINDGGVIVGCLDNYLDDFPDPHRAFVYQGGVVTELHALIAPQPATDFTCARDVNDAGVVVGELDASGVKRGFVYRDGAAALIDQGARFLTTARAVNATGRIAGDGRLPGWDADQALVYDLASARILSLGVEATGALTSSANDVNAAGSVVGSMQLNVGHRAFLATSGRVFDLNDLVPAASGWVLEDALSINDAGQIVGSGYRSDSPSVQRYFLLDASAPPPSIACLIARVRALEARRLLSHGTATALVALLEGARRELRAGCERLAVMSLEIFADQVDRLIRARRLAPDVGQPLVDEAGRIVDDLLAH